jgi:hypothetical protein
LESARTEVQQEALKLYKGLLKEEQFLQYFLEERVRNLSDEMKEIKSQLAKVCSKSDDLMARVYEIEEELGQDKPLLKGRQLGKVAGNILMTLIETHHTAHIVDIKDLLEQEYEIMGRTESSKLKYLSMALRRQPGVQETKTGVFQLTLIGDVLNDDSLYRKTGSSRLIELEQRSTKEIG